MNEEQAGEIAEKLKAIEFQGEKGSVDVFEVGDEQKRWYVGVTRNNASRSDFKTLLEIIGPLDFYIVPTGQSFSQLDIIIG